MNTVISFFSYLIVSFSSETLFFFRSSLLSHTLCLYPLQATLDIHVRILTFLLLAGTIYYYRDTNINMPYIFVLMLSIYKQHLSC